MSIEMHPDTLMTGERLTLIVVGAVTTFLGTVVCILRGWTIYKKLRKSGPDDIAMLVAWFSALGFTITSYLSVKWGVGMDKNHFSASNLEKALQVIYAVEIFYYWAIYFIKMSFLGLYYRLSSGYETTFGTLTLATVFVLSAHFLSTMIVASVQCIPMKKYWDPATPGHCINITAFFYSTNVFTILSDLVILTLPISTLWNMRRPRAQRIAVCAAFLLGAVSTIASCIRLYSIRIYTLSVDPMRDAAPITTWSFIEIYLGIVCASGPALRAFFLPAQNSMAGSSDGSGFSNPGLSSKSSKTTKDPFSLDQFETMAGDEEDDEQDGLAKYRHAAPEQIQA